MFQLTNGASFKRAAGAMAGVVQTADAIVGEAPAEGEVSHDQMAPTTVGAIMASAMLRIHGGTRARALTVGSGC